MNDPPWLSRRELLLTATTAGAAATAGSGVVALVHDTERFPAELQAGTLELNADPSWENTGSLGSVSEGEGGSETVGLVVSGNPAYIWFRTRCPTCAPVEEALFVRLGIDTNGDGTIDLPISEQFRSLRESRRRYGNGIRLGTLTPDDQWDLRLEWELREPAETDTVTFAFEFNATQTRSTDPDTLSSPWPSCEDCQTTSTNQSSTPANATTTEVPDE